MEPAFRDQPGTGGARYWRRSRWGAVGSGITFFLSGVLTLAAVVFGVSLLISPDSTLRGGELVVAALGLLVFIGVMGALARLVWRDMRGKMAMSITLTDAGLTLRLPPGRSLIHDPPRVAETIAWSDVRAVETRLEMYGAQGMAMMNRVYRLRRREGEPVFLFEERGLESNLQTASMRAIAEEIASRAGSTVRELGTFEGRGGFLGAWFSAPPDWSAAPVSRTRREVLRKRMAFTATTLGLVVAVMWLARLFV